MDVFAAYVSKNVSDLIPLMVVSSYISYTHFMYYRMDWLYPWLYFPTYYAVCNLLGNGDRQCVFSMGIDKSGAVEHTMNLISAIDVMSTKFSIEIL